MKNLNAFFCSLFILFILSGCTNAIYFYETEKVSITLEARPDPSQPVSGNVGIKQRVVVITPPKEDNGTPPKKDDAVSMISKFNLVIEEDTRWNPITIESTLLTGEAVTGLGPTEKQRAFEAVGGISPTDFTPALTSLRVLYDAIESVNPDFGEDKEQERSFQNKRTAIISNLNNASNRILGKFPESFKKYQWNSKTKVILGSGFEVPVGEDGFKALTFYRDGLKLSVESLQKLTKNFQEKDFEFYRDSEPVSDLATKQEYTSFHDDQRDTLQKLDTEIKRDGAVQDAFKFYTDLFLNG